jgi:hypothetical protein
MTLHLILLTKDADGCPDGFVWAADRKASFEWGQSADIEKIVHLKERAIACSAWGNHALTVREEFVKRINDGSIKLEISDLDRNREILQQFAEEMAGEEKTSRGLIVAMFGNSLPLLYRVDIARPAIPVLVEYYNLLAGDGDNPANIFATYYYAEKSGSSLPEALLLATHTMRLAQIMKLSYLGDPSIWYFSEGQFQRLPSQELARYALLSQALDESLIEKIRAVAPKRVPSPIENLIREKS